MSKYVIDPIVNEPSKGGWMEEYTLSLAKSYAKSLDQMVYRHLNRFERFLVDHKVLWPVRVFSRLTIAFDIDKRTYTIMRGKRKLETIKTL